MMHLGLFYGMTLGLIALAVSESTVGDGTVSQVGLVYSGAWIAVTVLGFARFLKSEVG